MHEALDAVKVYSVPGTADEIIPELFTTAPCGAEVYVNAELKLVTTSIAFVEQVPTVATIVGGAGIASTVIVIVVLLAFCPPFGINVYKVVAVLFNAGDQVPVIPLLEMVGKAAKVAPEQIGFTCVKVGVTIEFTVIVIVTTVAHCPAFGVKVYKVVAVLFKAGDHVPTIPLIEVVDKLAKVPPDPIGLTCVKVGVTIGLTVIVIVATEAH